MASSDILLNGVAINTTGTGRLAKGPLTIFVDGTLAGDIVSIQTCAVLTGGVEDTANYVEVLNFTAKGRQNLLQFGAYFVRAVLSSSSGATVTARTS